MDTASTRGAPSAPVCSLGPCSALLAACLLSGCAESQSALHPAGDDAAAIERLATILFGGAAGVFALVAVLLLLALVLPSGARSWLGSERVVILGGIALPAVVLSALLVYGLHVLRQTDVSQGDALRIEVTGEQFWWRIAYAPEPEAPAFFTANELRVPVGRPVAVSLGSADVIHSFWAPNLAGKIDMIPGRLNELTFTAQKPGVYRGQCAEFCGDQHAWMAFDVVALPQADFALWRQGQARDASPPSTPFAAEGRRLFLASCGNCHSVRGTQAAGTLGPDLTHIASRLSLGAGLLPNNLGTLAGWIAGTQRLKPGARMPSFGAYSGEELRAIATYLNGLE